MNKGIKNIILVDDHQIVIDGLTSLFNQMNGVKVVATFTDPKKALFYLESRKVDLVITDLTMAPMSGAELTAQIKERNPEIKVMALTMHHDVKHIREMVDLGADGYLLKNTEFSELEKAIKQVLSGQKFYGPKISSAINSKFKPQVEVNGKKVALSKRELGILELIADGLTTEAIAKKLYISKHTVNSHRRSLNVKLSVSRPAELISRAKELSLI